MKYDSILLRHLSLVPISPLHFKGFLILLLHLSLNYRRVHYPAHTFTRLQKAYVLSTLHYSFHVPYVQCTLHYSFPVPYVQCTLHCSSMSPYVRCTLHCSFPVPYVQYTLQCSFHVPLRTVHFTMLFPCSSMYSALYSNIQLDNSYLLIKSRYNQPPLFPFNTTIAYLKPHFLSLHHLSQQNT